MNITDSSFFSKWNIRSIRNISKIEERKGLAQWRVLNFYAEIMGSNPAVSLPMSFLLLTFE